MVLNQFFTPMQSYSTFPSTYSEASFLAAQRRLRYRNVFLYIFVLVAFVLFFTLYLFGGVYDGANSPIKPSIYTRSFRARSRVLITGFQPFANYSVNPVCMLRASFTILALCAYVAPLWKSR